MKILSKYSQIPEPKKIRQGFTVIGTFILLNVGPAILLEPVNSFKTAKKNKKLLDVT